MNTKNRETYKYKNSTLTDKQKRFCDEYLVDMNGTQAAIRSGYSNKTARAIANENLTKPNIQEYLQERIKKRSKDLNIDAEEVIKRLDNIYQRCAQETPIIDKSGNIVGSKFDSSGAIKATELIGKHLGMFTDKIDHTTNGESIDRKIQIEIVRKKDD